LEIHILEHTHTSFAHTTHRTMPRFQPNHATSNTKHSKRRRQAPSKKTQITIKSHAFGSYFANDLWTVTSDSRKLHRRESLLLIQVHNIVFPKKLALSNLRTLTEKEQRKLWESIAKRANKPGTRKYFSCVHNSNSSKNCDIQVECNLCGRRFYCADIQLSPAIKSAFCSANPFVCPDCKWGIVYAEPGNWTPSSDCPHCLKAKKEKAEPPKRLISDCPHSIEPLKQQEPVPPIVLANVESANVEEIEKLKVPLYEEKRGTRTRITPIWTPSKSEVDKMARGPQKKSALSEKTSAPALLPKNKEKLLWLEDDRHLLTLQIERFLSLKRILQDVKPTLSNETTPAKRLEILNTELNDLHRSSLVKIFGSEANAQLESIANDVHANFEGTLKQIDSSLEQLKSQEKNKNELWKKKTISLQEKVACEEGNVLKAPATSKLEIGQTASVVPREPSPSRNLDETVMETE